MEYVKISSCHHLRAHQSHYEQFGDLRGVVKVDSDTFELDLNVMRDHTHGSNRDWRLMHRYGIQNFRTANGFRYDGGMRPPSTDVISNCYVGASAAWSANPAPSRPWSLATCTLQMGVVCRFRPWTSRCGHMAKVAMINLNLSASGSRPAVNGTIFR